MAIEERLKDIRKEKQEEMRNGKLFDKKEWKKNLQYVKQKPYTTQSVLTREDGKIITNHHEYIKETIKCIEKATQQKLYKTNPKGIEISEIC